MNTDRTAPRTTLSRLTAGETIYVSPPCDVDAALGGGRAWAVTWTLHYVGVPTSDHDGFSVEEAPGKGWAVYAVEA